MYTSWFWLFKKWFSHFGAEYYKACQTKILRPKMLKLCQYQHDVKKLRRCDFQRRCNDNISTNQFLLLLQYSRNHRSTLDRLVFQLNALRTSGEWIRTRLLFFTQRLKKLWIMCRLHVGSLIRYWSRIIIEEYPLNTLVLQFGIIRTTYIGVQHNRLFFISSKKYK